MTWSFIEYALSLIKMQAVPQFWFDQVLIPKLLVPPPSNCDAPTMTQRLNINEKFQKVDESIVNAISFWYQKFQLLKCDWILMCVNIGNLISLGCISWELHPSRFNHLNLEDKKLSWLWRFCVGAWGAVSLKSFKMHDFFTAYKGQKCSFCIVLFP